MVEVLGGAELREYLAQQMDFWSVSVGTRHVLDPGRKAGRCSQCEGIEVGWVGGEAPCYVCKRTVGGSMETCIRCGCRAHVREQVYINGGEGLGHHVVHDKVRWVEVIDGEVVVEQCGGVHPGRWVGGMCPTCCCVVAKSSMNERRGGWVSEVVQERMQRMEELVALNVSRTMERGGGRSIGRARLGNMQEVPGGETRGSGGQGSADVPGVGVGRRSAAEGTHDRDTDMEVDTGMWR